MTEIKIDIMKKWLSDRFVVQDKHSKKFISSSKQGGELTEDPKLAKLYDQAEATAPHLSYLNDEHNTEFEYVPATQVADLGNIVNQGDDKNNAGHE